MSLLVERVTNAWTDRTFKGVSEKSGGSDRMFIRTHPGHIGREPDGGTNIRLCSGSNLSFGLYMKFHEDPCLFLRLNTFKNFCSKR